MLDCICNIYYIHIQILFWKEVKYPASNLRKREPFYPILHSNWNNQVLFLVGSTITYTSGKQVITFSCIFISVNNLWVGSLSFYYGFIFYHPCFKLVCQKISLISTLEDHTKLSAVPSLNVTISLIYFGISSSAGMIELPCWGKKIFCMLPIFLRVIKSSDVFMLSFFCARPPQTACLQQPRHISLC